MISLKTNKNLAFWQKKAKKGFFSAKKCFRGNMPFEFF